jgi:hypothetical protein
MGWDGLLYWMEGRVSENPRRTGSGELWRCQLDEDEDHDQERMEWKGPFSVIFLVVSGEQSINPSNRCV